MPDDESLTFVLHGENDIVPVDALVDAVKRIAKLVYDVQYVAGRGLKPRPWVIVRLSSSSPSITIRPAVKSTVATVPIVLEGLRAVASEGEMPAELPAMFGEDALVDLRRIGQGLSKRGGLTDITFSANGDSTPTEVTRIDQRIRERVDSVLRSGYTEHGSIEGRVDAIQTHRGRWFTVWDDVTGAPVRCPIPEGRFWLERAKAALTTRQVVSGQIRYFGNGLPRSITVEEMKPLAQDAQGPKATFGGIPDIIGDEDSVEYIRRLHE